jgi:sorbitol-specific phosphotransferase system component IIC
MGERTEALMRIVVGIITGLILGLWKIVIQVLVIIHWFIALITGERIKDLADFCELWNTQVYKFLRYMAFVTNERPFPFNPLGRSISKFK